VHFATCQTSLAQSHFEAVVDLLGQEAIALQLKTSSDHLDAAVREFAGMNIKEPLSSHNSSSNSNTANADRHNTGSSSATAAGAAKRRYSVDSLTVRSI
jgi:hypothetical protein